MNAKFWHGVAHTTEALEAPRHDTSSCGQAGQAPLHHVLAATNVPYESAGEKILQLMHL